MDGSHTLNDQAFVRNTRTRRAGDGKSRRIAVGVALMTGAFLAIAPVAVMAISPDRAHADADAATTIQQDAALVAFTGRAVELDGAIMNFSQQGNAINLSLMATDNGQRVFVQDAAGELFEIPVSPGQTNVSAELPAHFAASETLTFRVD